MKLIGHGDVILGAKAAVVERMIFDSTQSHVFMSYARDDDDYLNGDITWLRGALERAIKANTGVPLMIFQDVEDIVPGNKWANKLIEAIESAQLFVPILTPTFFKSDFCRREAWSFFDHEERAGRDDLVVPIYLIGIDFIEDVEKRAKDELLAKFYERQFDDWREQKFDLRKPATRPKIEKFAGILADAAGLRTQSQSRFGNRLVDENKIAPEPRDLREPDLPKTADTRDEDRPISLPTRNRNLGKERNPDGRETVSSEKGRLHLKNKWILALPASIGLLAYVLGVILLFDEQRSTQDELGSDEREVGSSDHQTPTLTDQLRALKEESIESSETLPEKEENFSEPVEIALARPNRRQDQVPPEMKAPYAGQQPAIDGTDLAHLSGSSPTCELCPEMVVIPSGTFLMGSSKGEDGRYSDEGPQRQVTIDRPFTLGKYEVTRAEFGIFVSETGHEAAGCMLSDGKERVDDLNRDWRNPGYEQTEKDPVVCVNWDDAKAYVVWLSDKIGEEYRLPSEAEWEYAARAGSSTAYFWGDAVTSACNYANGHDLKTKEIKKSRYKAFPCEDDYAESAPVGRFQPNGFGLHDMTGNIWEWVEDSWHDNYEGAPTNGRPWTEANEERRVLRGGSWGYNPRNLRTANRREAQQSDRNAGDGFRVAKTLSP